MLTMLDVLKGPRGAIMRKKTLRDGLRGHSLRETSKRVVTCRASSSAVAGADARQIAKQLTLDPP